MNASSFADNMGNQPQPATGPSKPGRSTAEKAPSAANGLNRAKKTLAEEENWDDDFADGISFAKLGSASAHVTPGESNVLDGTWLRYTDVTHIADESDNTQTLMPSRTVNIASSVRLKSVSAKASGKQKLAPPGGEDDYSDLLADDDGGLAAKVANLKVALPSVPCADKTSSRPEVDVDFITLTISSVWPSRQLPLSVHWQPTVHPVDNGSIPTV